MITEAVAEAGGLTILMGVLGKVLKTVPRFPNEWIPLTLIVVGVGAYLSTNGLSVDNAVLGLLAASSATGVHQVASQYTKTNEKTIDIRDTPAGPVPPSNG